MSELIKELPIIDDSGKTLFDRDDRYIVPLYQRAFAWKEREIAQLIHDIYYMEETEDNYYLGSLIVSRKGNEYEVIDGQQRLTTLHILLKCLFEIGALEEPVSDTLKFTCRDKSNYTLEHLSNLIEDDRIEENIRQGKDIVISEITKKDFSEGEIFSLERFMRLLKKVVIYRIEVPKHTDLNRYFEIMNTRGEQLEQHDILKATLMGYLKNADEKQWFADIWEACSDMTGYVQMHFGTDDRYKIFGNKWSTLPRLNSIEDLGEKQDGKNEEYKTITQIISGDFQNDSKKAGTDNDDRIRFEGIIEFPYFLLHTLRVFVEQKNIISKTGKPLLERLLDDKKLTKAFENVIKNGEMNGVELRAQTETFSREFIICLLQCRFLFDKYIIKREYATEDADGKWSIKELYSSNKKPYYRNTDLRLSGEHGKTGERRTGVNIMIQSCLRVSYTSPKVMHWITTLLKWLFEDDFSNLDKLAQFSNVSEAVAKEDIRKAFFDVCGKDESGCYNLGVSTPHIVFNYLDYLLWKESEDTGGFVFEFRNSVEHWYPQHPTEGFEFWSHNDGVDNFGNLCIIQRQINSKFSNMPPDAKKSTYEDAIKKGSLKLRRMAELTVGSDGKNASYQWRNKLCMEHEKEMIKKLQDACYGE